MTSAIPVHFELKCRPHFLCLLLILATAAGSPSAKAQPAVQVGVRGGYNFGPAESSFVGADVRIGLPLLSLKLNPAAEYAFAGEGGPQLDATLNLLYTFGGDDGVALPYVGAGYAWTRTYPEDQDYSHGYRSVNLVSGLSFRMGPLRPFVQANARLGTFTTYVASGGVLLSF